MHMRKRATPMREYLLLDMNMVIRMMIVSDVILIGAGGLLAPIFAIFVLDFIEGGGAAVAGIAAAIYLVTKSVLQIPFATIIDKIRGEKDDFWVMFTGTLLGALLPLTYLIIDTPLELYIVQFIYGAVIAASFPSYMAIYTRHIDQTREGTEWGVYFTLTDFSAAVAASIGGVMADTMGFNVVIVILSILGAIGAFILFLIKPYLRLRS